jgi:adenosylcobinamide-phosphate synthase
LKRTYLLPTAWLFDQFAGDPEWLPHPVRLMGLAIARGESAIRHREQSSATEFISGAALTISVVASSYFLSRQAIRLATRQSPALGNAVELLLGWTCLAARSLEQEAAGVANAHGAGDLVLARKRLSRIVGRDTEHLDVGEINRALIETLAESASDGIIAPLFYMALGGVPLAMAYKAVNTLDSMIGHADARYFYFGKAAARLDDAANYAPARFTALGVVAASCLASDADPKAALHIWRRDGAKHKSPNAGQPESAMAGALHARLGGSNTYDGEVIPARQIGAEFPPPSLAQSRKAIRLVSSVTLLGLAGSILLGACIGLGACVGRRSDRTISQ